MSTDLSTKKSDAGVHALLAQVRTDFPSACRNYSTVQLESFARGVIEADEAAGGGLSDSVGWIQNATDSRTEMPEVRPVDR